MRILITNDDGIHAAGLIPLVKWAMKLGQVTVIAPKVEQSGKSHGIEIHKGFALEQVDLVAHGMKVERDSVDYLDSVSAQLDVSRLEDEFAPFGRNVEDQFVVSW